MLDILSDVYRVDIGKKKRLIALGVTDIVQDKLNFKTEPLSLVLYAPKIPTDNMELFLSTVLPCSRSEAKRLLKNNVKIEFFSHDWEEGDEKILGVRQVVIRE